MASTRAHSHEDGNESEGTLADSLREAGTALGEVVGHFTSNFRADRTAEAPSGAHALAGDPDGEPGTIAAQLRAAADNARDALGEKDFRGAASSLAGDAGAIVRDVAGSVSRAGGATVASSEAEEMKAALGSAAEEVRETLGRAVAEVRKRVGQPADDSSVEGDIIDGEVVGEDGGDTDR